jgi:hypothetical protein
MYAHTHTHTKKVIAQSVSVGTAKKLALGNLSQYHSLRRPVGGAAELPVAAGSRRSAKPNSLLTGLSTLKDQTTFS